MKTLRTPVTHGPPLVRHSIHGVRLEDAPVTGIEVLMHRHVLLKQWSLRSAADAYWRVYWPISKGGHIAFEGMEFPLEPGFLYLITPGTAFDSECIRPFSKWYIHFTAGLMNESFRSGVVRIRPTARIRALLSRICPSVKQPTRKGEPGINPLDSLEVALLTLRKAQPSLRFRSPYQSRLSQCVDYLRERMNKKVTLHALAQLTGVSIRTLSLMFASELGFSPMRYLTELRLNRAMELLRHTDKAIEQIAEECGFANRYFFTRMMSKYRQSTPAAFRKQAKS